LHSFGSLISISIAISPKSIMTIESSVHERWCRGDDAWT